MNAPERGPPTVVLHAVESFSSGTLRLLTTLCRATAGPVIHHVLHGNRDEGAAARPEGFPDGTSFTPWPVGRAIAPVGDRRALAVLNQTVARLRPALVHAHSSKAGALVRIAFPDGRLPVVYSPHSYAFLRRDLNPVLRAAYWSIERLLGLSDHVTVACGTAEYGLARQVSRRVLQIPNMVDLAAIDRAIGSRPVADPGRPLLVGTAGGIRPQKNFPLFCRVAEALAGTGMRFRWIGGGEIPPGVRVPAHVEVTGWLGHGETLTALSACDIYIQTSRWEGLSIAVLEGMALGLPVLATPAVGNAELVIEGHNGYLCPDASEFVARLRAFDADRGSAAALGAASRRLIAEGYTVDRIAPRWLSLYRHYQRYRRHG